MKTITSVVDKLHTWMLGLVIVTAPFQAVGFFGLMAYYAAKNPTFVDDLSYTGFLIYLAYLPLHSIFVFSLPHWAGGFLLNVSSNKYWQLLLGAVAYLMHLSGYPVLGFYLGYAWRVGEGFQGALVVVLGATSLMVVLYAYYSIVLGGSGVERKDKAVADAGDKKSESTNDQQHTFNFTQPKITLDSLAGMEELKLQLREITALYAPYKTKKGPIADRNGILFSGPPGNGKTAFAEAMAGEMGLRFVKVTVSDIASKWVNETPSVLKSLFAQALQEPTMVFFDEFDAIATSRGGNTHSEDKKAVNALLPLIDEARKHRVVLAAATNFPDNLDQAIARDGRFDFRVEIPYPDRVAREAILGGLLAKYKIKVEPAHIRKVAELWERRSVAFIESTVKRLRDNGFGSKGVAPGIIDFKKAARDAGRRPSAIPKDGPKISELALPATVRTEADSLLYRLRHWEDIAEQGGEVPSGVLLYGPPGTGKTAFVRAVARELGDWHVFEVNTTDVVNDPRKFRDLVQQAADHRPAFIFLDEADELLRERMGSMAAGATNEILKCMDGMMGKVPEVVFIAATNNPEALDAAAVRGGRFAEKILMPRLSGDDLVIFLRKEMDGRTQVEFDHGVTPHSLAELFDCIAPADALAVMRKAVNYTLGQSGARAVRMDDFARAMEAIGV